mmetsp:Transcript_56209/g.161325  ORF Transcript_56209/g.161325 Transcript_56209/m.161325 type:complete len:237 (+) Transcript_56209:814-1524(+)
MLLHSTVVQVAARPHDNHHHGSSSHQLARPLPSQCHPGRPMPQVRLQQWWRPNRLQPREDCSQTNPGTSLLEQGGRSHGSTCTSHLRHQPPVHYDQSVRDVLGLVPRRWCDKEQALHLLSWSMPHFSHPRLRRLWPNLRSQCRSLACGLQRRCIVVAVAAPPPRDMQKTRAEARKLTIHVCNQSTGHSSQKIHLRPWRRVRPLRACRHQKLNEGRLGWRHMLAVRKHVVCKQLPRT